ncbi:conserved Plasmodium protein, unknown function [Plasmodium knowlesi strain H]|uniref:Uncharacterized protein n=3 Tax=Plasmodium knowlesi TaxID=5850 RepID=A0A5K1V0U4_PLAKH|nr:conserved Plasmodium protein, unknown function [Plasmodium knowlesi strain H]OTN65989.1 Uncharacterized protein PKNOH_S100060600 [Plasmodium knowlesi]CAA9987959.1 conserved Plasmodium protein, unknown function [Plasmodium knowlesi strain H]SBO22155.1 conserved Plasmodium protein, unknown function [Plasmodium knowlesi strain H]SBO29183.1 conserved Plasmodium protein, unknown function [Plasmodium knowlesi strain H]VVS77433.1 conserved Plasmodium protein, unknown function [Plasmodium knowlesi |eukprot:XP_002258938.1 hypothetical protein, conserved in Plasmodium species [Plasmodium knowlesi strain H]
MLELNYYHGEIFEKYKINSVLSALVDKHKLQNGSIDFNELSNRKNNYSIMALLGSQIKNFNDDVYKDIDTNDIILALSKLKEIDEQITINENRNKNYILEMAEQMYYEYSQKGLIGNENSFHLNDKENFIRVNLQLMHEINAGIRGYQNKIPYLRSYWDEKYPRADALLPIGEAPHHNSDAENYNISGLIERDDYYNVKQNEQVDDRGRNLLGRNTYPSRKNSQVFVNRTSEHDLVDELGPREDDSHVGVVRGGSGAEYGAEKGLCNVGRDGKSNLYQYRKEGTNSTYGNSVENVNGPSGARRRGSLNFLGEEDGDGTHIGVDRISGINDDRGERLGERSARSTSNHRRRSSLSNATRYHHGEQALLRDPVKGAYLKKETVVARPSGGTGQGRKTAQYERDEEDNSLTENNHRNSALSSAQDLGIAMDNESTTHRRRSFYDADHANRINGSIYGNRHTRAHASGSGKGIFGKNVDLLPKEDLKYYGTESKRSMSNVNSIMGTYHEGGIFPRGRVTVKNNIFSKKDLNNNGRNGNNAPNSVLENIDKAEQEIVNNHLKNSLTQNEYVARRMSSILLNPTMQQKEIYNSRVVPSYDHHGQESVTKFAPRNPSNGNNYRGDHSLQKYSTLGQRKNYTADTNNNNSFIVSSSVNKNNTSEGDSVIHVIGGADHENKQFLARPRNSFFMRERNMHFNSMDRNNSSNTPLMNMDSVSNFSRNVPKSIESNLNMYTNKHSRALDINDLNSNTSRNYVNSSNSFKSDFTAMRENYAKMLDRSKSLTSQIYRPPVAQRYM